MLCDYHSVIHRLNSLDTMYLQIPKVTCTGWYHWGSRAGPGWRKVTRDEFFEGCIGYPLLPFSLLPDHPAVSSYDYPPNQMSNTVPK